MIRRSPLDGVRLIDGLRELPFLAQLSVRTSTPGTMLPTGPNTVAGDATRAALWLGPDEWLVVGPPGSGTVRSVASVNRPSVPSEPVRSRGRSSASAVSTPSSR